MKTIRIPKFLNEQEWVTIELNCPPRETPAAFVLTLKKQEIKGIVIPKGTEIIIPQSYFIYDNIFKRGKISAWKINQLLKMLFLNKLRK